MSLNEGERLKRELKNRTDQQKEGGRDRGREREKKRGGERRREEKRREEKRGEERRAGRACQLDNCHCLRPTNLLAANSQSGKTAAQAIEMASTSSALMASTPLNSGFGAPSSVSALLDSVAAIQKHYETGLTIRAQRRGTGSA